jgi:hypothetical protein
MELFDQYQEALFQATTWAVQNSVPLGVFEVFVALQKLQREEFEASLPSLLCECFLPELVAECGSFLAPVGPIGNLQDSACELDHRILLSQVHCVRLSFRSGKWKVSVWKSTKSVGW